jgi:hypothetical protein
LDEQYLGTTFCDGADERSEEGNDSSLPVWTLRCNNSDSKCFSNDLCLNSFYQIDPASHTLMDLYLLFANLLSTMLLYLFSFMVAIRNRQNQVSIS